MTNVAETANDHEDAQLRTRRYKTDLPTVKKAIGEIIPRLSTYLRNWRLIDSGVNPASDSTSIKVEVPVVIFTDDLRIDLKTKADDVIVNMRSASRIGRNDFGENRRHILQLLKKLDEKLVG